VTLPAFVLPDIAAHLDQFTAPGDDSLAALIYQHRTAERDRLIAAAMSQLITAELNELPGSSGTQRARDAAPDEDLTGPTD
jgi:hypothetical protein